MKNPKQIICFVSKALIIVLCYFSLCSGSTKYQDTYSHESVCPGGGLLQPEDSYSGVLQCYVDSKKFAQCNCTSYVSSKLNEHGIDFSNSYKEQTWSHGRNWDDVARNIGIAVDNIPLPGDVAYWNETDSNVYGHVAWVEKVHFDADGNPVSIDITEYNYTPYEFGERIELPVNDPDGYIHILAYNEGVKTFHYLDSYEMYNLCDTQTQSEWDRILSKVWQDYRCTSCESDSDYDPEEIAWLANMIGMGGGPGSETTASDSSTPDLPDFVLDELKITDTSDHERYTFNNTNVIELHAYSKNIGDADWAAFNGEPEADDIYVKFYLSNGYKEDAHSDWDCVGTQQIQKGNLDVGDTKHEEDALNLYAANDGAPLAPGVYNIVACVDRKYDQDNGDGEVPEEHKSNNCSTEAVFIVKEPNLRISELSTGGRTVLNPGEQINLQTWTVNDGANVSSDIKLKWYLSSGDVYNNPTLIEEDNMLASNLETGEIKLEEALFTVPLTPGIYTLSVHTDSLNVFAEVNENDNWQHVTVEVFNVTEPPAAPAAPAMFKAY